VPNVQWKTPDDGQRKFPKHVEFYNRINLDNKCVWLVIKKKSVTMHGGMSIKCSSKEIPTYPRLGHAEHLTGEGILQLRTTTGVFKAAFS